MAKGRKRILKVCPNCGSSSVRPAKQVDDWASVEEAMETAGEKWECDECGYKGELIGVAEEPEEDELEAEEKEEQEEEIEKPVKAEKPHKTEKANKKIKRSKGSKPAKSLKKPAKKRK
ncbi:MAG: hypothetical protein V1835_05360 [Candidatus Micrarchaeota archaeon]